MAAPTTDGAPRLVSPPVPPTPADATRVARRDLPAAPIADELLAAWLATTTEAVVVVQPDGRVLVHSAAASRLTGVGAEVAVGQPWQEIVQVPASTRERLWQARHGAEPQEIVTELICAQGNARCATIVARGLRHGETPGLLLLLREEVPWGDAADAAGGRSSLGSLVGAHPAMQALYDLVSAVARSDVPVLVEGERGSGKELVAQVIHARSRRAERPLVVVDCEALPPASLAAELFGQLRAAQHASLGRAELAHTGTLVLHELCAASLPLQGALLRFLETGRFERVGDGTPRHVDVRVIATLRRAPAAEIRAGRLREDLARRIGVAHVVVPPLRERRTDLPLLARVLLTRVGRPDLQLDREALAVLAAYRWPGNTRELEHVLRQAVGAVEPGATRLTVEHLPEALRTGAPVASTPAASTTDAVAERRALLLRALSAHGGNRAAAARALGIGRATFYRWWKEAGL